MGKAYRVECVSLQGGLVQKRPAAIVALETFPGVAISVILGTTSLVARGFGGRHALAVEAHGN